MSDTLPALSASERRELIRLVRLRQDGTLQEQLADRFEELVCRRADGRSIYFRAARLNAGLHWYYAPQAVATREFVASFLAEVCGASTDDNVANHDVANHDVAGHDVPGDIAGDSSAPDESKRQSASGLPEEIHTAGAGVPVGWLGFVTSAIRVVPGGEFVVGGLLLLAVTGAIWGVIHFAPDSSPAREVAQSLSDLPARATRGDIGSLKERSPARWSASTSQSAQATARIGQRYELASGWIQMDLARGTRIAVGAPAVWMFASDQRLQLDAGRLIAEVPAAAIGFTVETPTATIVDLGTEFQVEVAEGKTVTTVVRGKVNVTPVAAPSHPLETPLRTQRLSAGESLRIFRSEAKGIESQRSAQEEAAPWTRPIAAGGRESSPDGLRLVSLGRPTTASSTFDMPAYKFSPAALTDGRTQDGGRSGDYNYWLARVAANPVECVVDLEESYRVVEIDLYNTHNANFQNSGTKDFRLSLSDDRRDYAQVVSGTLASTIGSNFTAAERFVLEQPTRGRYLKFEALSRYGEAAGLNEIAIYAALEPPALAPVKK